MPAGTTQPTGKRSKRGRLSEGAPTKRTDEVVIKIANAIALGLADDEAAAFSGIDDATLTRWKRDPEFCGKIKNAVSTRLAMRLSKIESGADGWQGCAWLVERLLPSRFARPEVQISLNNSFNQTVNALSITITPEEARRIEAVSEPVRQSVREMFAQYRPQLEGGNGHHSSAPAFETPAKVVGPPIVRKDGDENSPSFWSQFVGDPSRVVQKQTAIFVAKTIVDEVLGCGRGTQALVAFKSEPVTVADVLATIDKLCGGSPVGWQRLQKRAGIHAGSGA